MSLFEKLTSNAAHRTIRSVALSATILIGSVGLWGCSRPVALPSGPPAVTDTEMAGTRPNIILIMADDLGYSDLGSYGATIIQTPNLDRLAEGGLRFTQFYNAARCVPTRGSLLTGLYPHQSGLGRGIGGNQYLGTLSRNAITLAEGLGAAGYDTFMSGKWHVTPWRPGTNEMAENGPTARGFDRYYGIMGSIRGYYDPPTLMEDGRELPRTEGDYHFTDAVAEHAVQYITEQDDDPYFLYVAFSSPHFPLHAREEDIARYRGRFLEGWDELSEDRYERMIELGIIDPSWPRPTGRDAQELPWDQIHPEYRAWFDERMAVYAAMIEQTDRGIGAILDAVEARGDLENTIVIFLSDNGACAEEIGPNCQGGGCFTETRGGLPVRYGNNPNISPGPEDTYQSVGLEWAGYSNTPFRRYKSFTHEGGIATPLIVSWPSRIGAGIVREQGHIIDLMPTFLELAGAEYPTVFNGNTVQPMAGRSLIPLFQGGTRPETVYVWEHEGNRAIRAGDWKLVNRLGQDWELFNMSTDRLEANDLAGAMPARVATMAALYDEWAARTGIIPATGGQTAIGVADPTIYTRFPWAPTGYPWNQGGRGGGQGGGGGGQGGRGGGQGAPAVP